MNLPPLQDGPVWAVGFMTGTSVDAVDGAIILTDGEGVAEVGPAVEVPYTEDDRRTIVDAVEAARAWNWKGPKPEQAFKRAEAVAVDRHGEALDRLLDNWSGSAPVVAGIHGQTVLHRRPARGQPGATLQIIDSAALQRRLNLPIAYDFRSADVNAGGEGAPLAPIYHQALLQKSGLENTAVVNLGGVANITFVTPSGDLLAFDAGPANGPIDEWVAGHGRGSHDPNGAIAAAGSVHWGLIDQILDHPYFDDAPPKSLDRFDFDANLARGLSLEDGAATLTALCAAGLDRGLQHFDGKVDQLVICGGGRRNPTLLSMLEQRLGPRVVTAEQVGWRGDSMEAEAFAYLAVRRLRDLPISFPKTTGVPHPMTGGRLLSGNDAR
ncbi:MAG: anhydro-N-acetylmuramic acid kinase [Pseudomonadota bacterium]